MEPLEKALAGACSGKADGLVKIFEPGDLHRLTSRQIGVNNRGCEASQHPMLEFSENPDLPTDE